MTITATSLDCTLEPSPADSSTDVMLDLFRDAVTTLEVGHQCSVAQRALERLHAFISETDDRGPTPTVDRVSAAANGGHLARLLANEPYPATA